MGDLHHYDLNNVSLNLFGMEITGGYGNGGSIKITRNSELYTSVVGRDGTVVRSKNMDNSVTIEITVLQTSEVNSRLKAIQALDNAGVNGAGVGNFMCRDLTNGDEYFAEKAWIHQLPEVEFAQEQTDRVWTLMAADLEHHPGGRAPVSVTAGIAF